MNKPRVWPGAYGCLLTQGIFYQAQQDGISLKTKLPGRIRIPAWKVDVFFAKPEPAMPEGAPRYFDPLEVVKGERVVRVPIALFPQEDDDWVIQGSLFGSFERHSNLFVPRKYENNDFDLKGHGPSLDNIVMRAKLAGWVKGEALPD